VSSPSAGDETVAVPDPTARQVAVTELGTAVRELVRATVETEVAEQDLTRAAELARAASELLRRSVRPADQLAGVDRPRPGQERTLRMYSPVLGPGNPVSPPVTVLRADREAAEVEATYMLSRVHEGPPTYGHGGMSAMILDQLLGGATALTGRLGLTRSLELRYHRPVPLDTPLRIVARIASTELTRVVSTGEITTVAEPDVVLVSATGTFLVPRPDQLTRLFGHVRQADRAMESGD
jgi:acyl-coenzyme A thioesterase PaaI-like protein